MNYGIIATVGRTDLKVLARSATGEPCLAEVRNATRAFHEWLQKHPEKWAVAPPAGKLPPSDRREIRWIDGRFDPTGLQPVTDDGGRLQLVCSKLGPAVAALKLQGDTAVGALVLTTRTSDRGDPIALGDVLVPWLKENLGLDGTAVMEGCFLEGDEELSGDDEATPVRKAAGRIDRSIREFLGAIESSGRVPEVLHLMTQGGFPDFKPVVEASVRLHGAAKVNIVRDQEKRGSDRAVEVEVRERSAPWPAHALAVRKQVIDLIERGGFVEAWECVPREFKKAPSEVAWVTAIAEVAAWFEGQYVPTAASAVRSALPDPGVAHRMRWLGFRIEAALARGHDLDALVLLFAFGDAAPRDLIEADGLLTLIDSETVAFANGVNQPPAAIVTALDAAAPRVGARCWNYKTLSAGPGAWDVLHSLPSTAAVPAVQAMLDALRPPAAPRRYPARLTTLSALRNQLAHGDMPSRAQITDNLTWAEQSGLLSRMAPVGERFLGRWLIDSIFSALDPGGTRPADEYIALLKTVTGILRNHPIQ